MTAASAQVKKQATPKSKPQYTGLGFMLKEARESQGLSLERATDELKIRSRYLVAIESGRFEMLPGRTYAVGYVKVYGEYLGFNPQEVTSLYRQERGQEQKEIYYAPEPMNESSRPAPMFIAIAVAGLFLLLVAWYAWQGWEEPVAFRTPEVPTVLEDTTSYESQPSEAEADAAAPADDESPTVSETEAPAEGEAAIETETSPADAVEETPVEASSDTAAPSTPEAPEQQAPLE